MKVIKLLFFLFLYSLQSSATIYTFQTGGDFTDASNWDIYPGTVLFSNDTISIEADCFNIDLWATDGYVVFSENVFNINIANLSITDECQIEFLASFFHITISGCFDFYSNNLILIPNNSYVFIDNYGYGLAFNSCPVWWDYANVYVEYYNNGTQNSFLIECMEGDFYNYGTIELDWSFLNLNFDLYLENGTIEGEVPFSIYQYNGSFNQNCSSCIATINNIENLQLNWINEIKGTVILNAPD